MGRKQMRIVTAMVCYCSRTTNASLLQLEKCFTSSGICRAYPRLRAICPPLPEAQFLIVKVTGRGPLPSIKVVCHSLAEGDEVEATLDLIYIARCVPLAGSRITMVAMVGAGGVLGGIFSGLFGGWSVLWCLFQVRGFGVGRSLSWACCCTIGYLPGKNQSVVIFL